MSPRPQGGWAAAASAGDIVTICGTHRTEKAVKPDKLPVDEQAMRARIAEFAARLPESESAARAAIADMLAQADAMLAQQQHYVPMQLFATNDRIKRAQQSTDLSAALRAEHLDVPIGNFGVVQESVLYRGAQPSRSGLQWLADHGVKTVVTLRRREVEDNYGYVDFTSAQEAEECRRLGMRHVEIPVTDMAVPTREQIEAFLELVNEPSLQPVYVHCAAGVGRTGVMCGIFERSRGVPMEQVQSDLEHYYMDPKTTSGANQLAAVRGWQPTLVGDWRIS